MTPHASLSTSLPRAPTSFIGMGATSWTVRLIYMRAEKTHMLRHEYEGEIYKYFSIALNIAGIGTDLGHIWHFTIYGICSPTWRNIP